jgi:hypothetical protein
MSIVRPVTFAVSLLTIVSACHLGDGVDDDPTLRDNPALVPSGGSTDGSEGGDSGVIPSGPADPGDLSDSGDSTTSDGSLEEDCFLTGPPGMTLGTAADYAILAKSAIATVPVSTVIGNLGLSPAAGSSITGFGLSMANTNDYATSLNVIGNIYAANYEPPTPDNLAAAIVDMQLAYANAASRLPDMTGLGGGNIGGMTLPPGVYNWDANLSIPSDVDLHGCERDIWVFQIAGDLSMSKKVSIGLVGGAEAHNVFWQVAGKAVIGAGAHFEGNLLAKSAVTLQTGATIRGRLLTQTKVILASNTVIVPE